jgi:hypothetical protein
MPTPHISTTDPLGLADAGVVNLISITPSQSKTFAEVLESAGKYIAAAIKTTQPLDQFECVYELLDDADVDVVLGVAFNTSYLVTAVSCSCGPDKYPQLTVTAIKPSSAGMIKANGAGITLNFVGGFGIVNKFGATAASAFISSQSSVSMQSLEAMDETSGDFLADGIYRFGFKEECSVEAYGVITAPTGATAIPNQPATPKESREGWQVYSASWWTYLDPYVAAP